MNGEHEEIVKILCDENWGTMRQDVFQKKMGTAMTYLLRRSIRMDWVQIGIVSASGFLGGAAVWIALILASGTKIIGG